jgi:hypothetical protein
MTKNIISKTLHVTQIRTTYNIILWSNIVKRQTGNDIRVLCWPHTMLFKNFSMLTDTKKYDAKFHMYDFI